jgi:hypothetical protein
VLFRSIQVGALLPIGAGSIYPNETRGSTVLGNVTLGGIYSRRASQTLLLKGALDVALPTASGVELPSASELTTSGHLDQTELDRHALLRAMSDSRGREDSASFASKHLGLVPKLGLVWTGREKLEVESYLKYQSLHGTVTNSAYEGSVVFLARATYRFHPTFDATLRAWTDVRVAGPDSYTVAVEPQVTGHFGALLPTLGVVVPVAGDLISPYAIGVRGALAARF